MRHHAALLALALALATGPLPSLAQGEDKREAEEPGARAEVEAYLEGLLAHDRHTFQIGELEAEVSVVPDYFMVILAREYLKTNTTGRSAEDLKTQFQRLAERSKKTIGRVGVIVKLSHPRKGGNNFYAFQGDIDDHVRAVAMGNISLGVASHRGPYERKEYTLFKANRSAVFTAEGQCPPVMRRQMVELSSEPLTVELVAKRELSAKAKKLEVKLGGFIHFTGSGMAGVQIDFENGALAVIEPAPEVEVPLPLSAPSVPAALAEVMPKLED
jgi:hypothetical protein